MESSCLQTVFFDSWSFLPMPAFRPLRSEKRKLSIEGMHNREMADIFSAWNLSTFILPFDQQINMSERDPAEGKFLRKKKLKTMGESCKFVIGCVFCSLVSDFWNDRICYRRPCAYIVKIQERKQGIGRRRNSRDACPLQTCACRQAFTLITMGKLM